MVVEGQRIVGDGSVASERLATLLTNNLVAAFAPALVLVAYVAVGVAVFAARGGRVRFPDEESSRRVTGLTSEGMRVFFAWLMKPWIRLLIRANVTANAITCASFVIAVGAAVALAHGRFALGGYLYLLAGACDFFDGRVAREQKLATAAGAALDSILDRYTEAAVLVGLAWFYRGTWVLLPVLLALVGSMLVPYVRARGESLQVASAGAAPLSQVGWLQRPERVVLLATSIALAPAFDMALPPNVASLHWLTIGGVLLVAVGTQLTAVQRTRHLVRALAMVTPSESSTPQLAQLPAGNTRRRSSMPVVGGVGGVGGASATSSASRAPASRSASWLRGH